MADEGISTSPPEAASIENVQTPETETPAVIDEPTSLPDPEDTSGCPETDPVAECESPNSDIVSSPTEESTPVPDVQQRELEAEQAAVAMAAVAAAAMANNQSPSQAALEARATAQAFLSGTPALSHAAAAAAAPSHHSNRHWNAPSASSSLSITPPAMAPPAITISDPPPGLGGPTMVALPPSPPPVPPKPAFQNVPWPEVQAILRQRTTAVTTRGESNDEEESNQETGATVVEEDADHEESRMSDAEGSRNDLSLILDRLGQGENQAFGEVLLLLAYFRCAPAEQIEPTVARDSNTATPARAEASEPDRSQNSSDSSSVAVKACDSLCQVLNDVESAYDALQEFMSAREEEVENEALHQSHDVLEAESTVSLLSELSPSFTTRPSTDRNPLHLTMPFAEDKTHASDGLPNEPSVDSNTGSTTKSDVSFLVSRIPNYLSISDENDGDDEDGISSKSLPDLLPPCSFPGGDPTAAFFHACLGEDDDRIVREERIRGVSSDDHSSFSAAADERPRPPAPPTTAPVPVTHSPTKPALSSSGVGTVFSTMFRRSSSTAADLTTSSEGAGAALPAATASSQAGTPGRSFANVFRKRPNPASPLKPGSSGRAEDGESTVASNSTSRSSNVSGSWVAGGVGSSSTPRPGEYVVRIDREQLGLTVENVLERTVVRTVLPGGPAKRAGAKIGSLIVKVGNVETKHLTHFETIDELRRSQRPLQLVLRQISDDDLRMAREEMGRLIRGAGFGNLFDGTPPPSLMPMQDLGGEDVNRSQVSSARLQRITKYTDLIHRRFSETVRATRNKKDESVIRAGEKMVWILVLFVVGLEREAVRLFSLARKRGEIVDVYGSDQAYSSPSRRNPHAMYHHSARDYADAARSISRVLLDYSRKRFDAQQNQPVQVPVPPPPPPPAPQKGRANRTGRFQASSAVVNNKGDGSVAHQKPLLQIGDVLQRTRTFLADTGSPPAALLRGELIAFLCDVLDIDNDMELLEEEPSSASGGASKGVVNDLGSAGSLLKLIVLNCPNMWSSNCAKNSVSCHSSLGDLQVEMQRRFGRKPDKFSTRDLHLLHAGNRFLAVVHRLAASRSTSARISACSLGTVIWNYLDFPHQLQLRGVITRALHDVEVIVRKSIAHVLHEIAELVYDPRSVTWLVLMCERAMTDPEPQLRSAAMTLTWHLAEHLPNAFLGDASQGSRYLRRLPERSDPIFPDVYLLQCKLLPVATRLAEDRSASVRLSVAAQCDRLCDALGAHWSSVVIDVLLALLSDSDERVRCEAILCVPRLSKIVMMSTFPGKVGSNESSILDGLVPSWMKLQVDINATVRASLAAASGEMLTLLVTLQRNLDVENANVNITEPVEADKRYQKQVDDRMIPLVQTLLNDRDPEVTSAALRAVTNASRSSMLARQERSRRMSTASEDDSASISSHHSHVSRERMEPVLMPVLSEQQVLRLLPTLAELSNSKQWRVRQSAVEIVPALLGCTHRHDTREDISKLCVKLMGDAVDAVRRTAAECLCMGGSALGSHGEGASSSSAEWFRSIVLPRVRECATHAESKQRLLSLRMVETILLNGACPAHWSSVPASAGGPKMISMMNSFDSMENGCGTPTSPSFPGTPSGSGTPVRELLVLTLSLSADPIANVRLNVSRTLEAIAHVCDDDDISFIQEGLTQQTDQERIRADCTSTGGDRDVLYFASRCQYRIRMILDDRITTHHVTSPIHSLVSPATPQRQVSGL
jgi:PDZ domain